MLGDCHHLTMSVQVVRLVKFFLLLFRASTLEVYSADFIESFEKWTTPHAMSGDWSVLACRGRNTSRSNLVQECAQTLCFITAAVYV